MVGDIIEEKFIIYDIEQSSNNQDWYGVPGDPDDFELHKAYRAAYKLTGLNGFLDVAVAEEFLTKQMRRFTSYRIIKRRVTVQREVVKEVIGEDINDF